MEGGWKKEGREVKKEGEKRVKDRKELNMEERR